MSGNNNNFDEKINQEKTERIIGDNENRITISNESANRAEAISKLAIDFFEEKSERFETDMNIKTRLNIIESSLKGNLPAIEDNKQDELPKIESKYYYKSTDFKGQDYVVTDDINRGEFMVPLRDTSDKKIGWLSWQSLAYPPEGDEKWSMQENLMISLGLENNANTYSGSALSLATNGYYETNVPYKFCVSNCDKKINLTITKISDTLREVIVSH